MAGCLAYKVKKPKVEQVVLNFPEKPRIMNMRSVVLLIAAFAVVSFLYVIRMLGLLELEEVRF